VRTASLHLGGGPPLTRKSVQALEPIQDDDSAVKKYGVELCVGMCRELQAAGTPGLHFYTLNLEKSVTQILEQLDLIALSRPARAFPWRSVTPPPPPPPQKKDRSRIAASSRLTRTGRKRKTFVLSSGPTGHVRTCRGRDSHSPHHTLYTNFMSLVVRIARHRGMTSPMDGGEIQDHQLSVS